MGNTKRETHRKERQKKDIQDISKREIGDYVDEILAVDLSKRGHLLKALLLIMVASGILVTLTALPGLAAAFKPFMGSRNNMTPAHLKRSFQSMEKKGWIKKKQQKDWWGYEITDFGIQKLAEFEIEQYKAKQKKKWDGKWRMIIFDIPNKEGWKRKFLRSQLFRIGFEMHQKSVWVYPYPCDDLVKIVKEKLDLRSEVLYAVVDYLEGDEELRKTFKLPKLR